MATDLGLAIGTGLVEGFFRQKKGRGGFGENPLSSSSRRQNRGREKADGRGLGRRCSEARRRPGSEAKGRGSRGESIPLLTSGGGGVRWPGHGSERRLALAGVAAVLRGWAGALAAVDELVEGWRCGGGLFIGRGEVGGGGRGSGGRPVSSAALMAWGRGGGLRLAERRRAGGGERRGGSGPCGGGGRRPARRQAGGDSRVGEPLGEGSNVFGIRGSIVFSPFFLFCEIFLEQLLRSSSRC